MQADNESQSDFLAHPTFEGRARALWDIASQMFEEDHGHDAVVFLTRGHEHIAMIPMDYEPDQSDGFFEWLSRTALQEGASEAYVLTEAARHEHGEAKRFFGLFASDSRGDWHVYEADVIELGASRTLSKVTHSTEYELSMLSPLREAWLKSR